MNKKLKMAYRYGTRRQKTFIRRGWRSGFTEGEILWSMNDGLARPFRWRRKSYAEIVSDIRTGINQCWGVL